MTKTSGQVSGGLNLIHVKHLETLTPIRSFRMRFT
jgi:hypothetical protein